MSAERRVVTETDRQQAVRLLAILGRRKPAKATVDALGQELAAIRETAVSCAVARLDTRERALVPACDDCLTVLQRSAGRATRCSAHLAQPGAAS